jgi:arabinose-5-phosphate isomerase
LVTDGDLRRELNDYKNESDLNKFMSKRPLVVNENMPAAKALAIMNEKKITSLLVVSDKDYSKPNKSLKGIIHIHFLLKNGIK